MQKLITYDLGTGGVKASLYDKNLCTISKSFIEYKTHYPDDGWHEQRPDDWWNSVIDSTHILLQKSNADPKDIKAIALSGHSLVTVPIDKNGNLITKQVPIWSDTRADVEAKEFFDKISESDWYFTTGNGFPPACYSIFKLMWFKKHYPEQFQKANYFIGSKDYINFKLTDQIFTDPSYASGTGAYDLIKKQMRTDFLETAGLTADIFPRIVPSHTIVGHVTKQAAALSGLCNGTVVACGGVDNACMALGTVGNKPGKVYTSLGSSSWIPVNSKKPILDIEKRPYVFAHIQENMFTSAYSIFAGGSSFRWIRETLCKDLSTKNAYQIMDQMASNIPIGANGIIFNPSLAGGNSQDKSCEIRGAFLGLNLGTTRDDLIRAAMEGIALNLRMSLDCFKNQLDIGDQIRFCGGGSKSKLWMQIFADVFHMNIIKSNIDQDAASIGAAAIAGRALGLWDNYNFVEDLHHTEQSYTPNEENNQQYGKLLKIFIRANEMLTDYGNYVKNLG